MATCEDLSLAMIINFLVLFFPERSTAIANCSGAITLNEGDDLICLCGHTGGNPPPTAVWSKDGSVLVTGYLNAYLVLKNVSNENDGTYKCLVKSHNLQDDKTFRLVVQCKYCNNIINYYLTRDDLKS